MVTLAPKYQESHLMSKSFSYTTSFILDKAHFSECYDQSATKITIKHFRKAAIIALVGLILLFVVGTNNYAAFFVIVLAAVEVLGIKYKKTWWLWRQMLSKASNHQVELLVDKKGITTSSFHVNSELFWSDVNSVDKTELGLLVRHQGGINYLSNSYLSDECIEFIAAKAQPSSL
ncbi:MAG: YcxB family protein [Psychrobium sp.]|nr:YcxB family protein [Psychrobium sp.]